MAINQKELQARVRAIIEGMDDLKRFADGVDEIGDAADATTQDTKELGQEFTGLSGIVGNVRNALLGLVSVAGLKALADQVIEGSDAWKRYESLLANVVDTEEERIAIEDKLFDISQRTMSDVEQNISLYTRLALNQKELNVSSEDLLNLTEAISKSFKISGATTEEAAAATRQLAQALGRGVLRGDEFISVMEGAPRLAKALAASLGVATGKLTELAENGKLSSQTVIQGLLDQKNVLDTEFDNVAVTVEGAMTRATNAWQKWIAEVDESAGFSDAIIDGLDAIAEHIDEIGAAAVVTGEAINAVFDGINERLESVSLLDEYITYLWSYVEAELALAKSQKEAAEITERQAQEFKSLSKELGVTIENQEHLDQVVADGLLVADEAAGKWELTAKGIKTFGLEAVIAAQEQKVLEEAARNAAEVVTKAYKALGIESTEALIKADHELIGHFRDISLLGSQAFEDLERSFEAVVTKIKTREGFAELEAQIRELGSVSIITSAQQQQWLEILNTQMAKVTANTKALNAAFGEGIKSSGDYLAVINNLRAALASGAITQKEFESATAQALEQLAQFQSKSFETAQALESQKEAAKGSGEAIEEAGDKTEEASSNVNSLNTAARALASIISGLRDELQEYGDKAVAVFDASLASVSRTRGGIDWLAASTASMGGETAQLEAELAKVNAELAEIESRRIFNTNDISAYITDVVTLKNNIKKAYLEEELAAKALERRLERLESISARQADSLIRAAKGYKLLDESTLSSIISQVEALRRETESLINSAEDTVNSLQQERARLLGDAEEELRLEYESRRQDLLDSIEEADDSRNKEALAEYQKALELLEENYLIEARQMAETAAKEAAEDAAKAAKQETKATDSRDTPAAESTSAQAEQSTAQTSRGWTDRVEINVNVGEDKSYRFPTDSKSVQVVKDLVNNIIDFKKVSQ